MVKQVYQFTYSCWLDYTQKQNIRSYMCGRYSLFKFLEQLESYFGATVAYDDFEPNYNAAPTQELPVVYQRDDDRLIDTLRWGLIPSTVDEKPDYLNINARGESLERKWPFKIPFQRGMRCLVPANGFYEWKGPKGDKQPYHIIPEEMPLFAFAGLYDIWESESGSRTLSYTIITTDAGDKMEELHDRMPAILLEEEFDAWLDPTFTDTDEVKSMIRPLPDDQYRYYPVSKAVNSYKNNNPELVEPQNDNPRPTLFDQ